jgi:hypothetical protein
MVGGVGRRRDVEAKLEVVVERAGVQSWNCGDDDARGGGAHDGGGAHPVPMGGTSAEAAIAGLAQDQYGNRGEYVTASGSAYVAVAVVVELYNASAAAAAVVVVVAAACAMRILIPAPSAQSPLSHVHLARTLVRWDARFLSLAPSH